MPEQSDGHESSPVDMAAKIFCIGFNKTGTTSMHRLFMDLGLKSCHDHYSDLPPSHPLFFRHQCFSDGELHDFELLDRAFPGSKFIVTTRSLEDWLISRVRHVEFRRSIRATGWMRKEYEADPNSAVKKWIERRLEYHQRVKGYFANRPNDLLIVDICTGADQNAILAAIVDFLGLDPPAGLTLTHNNARNEQDAAQAAVGRSKAEVRKEIVSVFQELGLEERMYRSLFP